MRANTGSLKPKGNLEPRPNPDFEPIEHSAYDGRRRLGRYERVAVARYAAFDNRDRPLGRFQTRKAAWAAIRRADKGGCQPDTPPSRRPAAGGKR